MVLARRARVQVHTFRALTMRVRATAEPPVQALKQTVGGGGYSGACDIDSIKEIRKECAGLEGEALEACWADSGCDVNEVTRHYSTMGAKSDIVPATQAEQASKQTVAGGGFSGVCDIAHVKQTLKGCAGLTGKALEACWADSGCDVAVVTEHYLKVAGLGQGEFQCFVTHDRHLVADGLPSGEYNVAAWWSGVQPNKDEGKSSSPFSAPACSANQREDCTLIVQKISDTDLVCPGLDTGVYQVTNIRDFGGIDKCSLNGSEIECEVDWDSTGKA